jgi:hypothetical protein
MTVFGKPTRFDILYTREAPSAVSKFLYENTLIVCSRFDTPVFDDVKSLCELALPLKCDVLVVRTQADRNNPWIQFGKVLEYCKAHDFPLFSTSAKNGVNVTELFRAAAIMVFNRF